LLQLDGYLLHFSKNGHEKIKDFGEKKTAIWQLSLE